MSRLILAFFVLLATAMLGPHAARAENPSPFNGYLGGQRPALIAFNPSRYDPRTPPTGAYPADELRADLAALRPAFDGLVLYGFDPTLTPGILEQAASLGYRAVLLGIWDPKSETETAGVADLIRRYRDRLALAVCIGNEGISDNRYTIEDLGRAGDHLRRLTGTDPPVPVTTSEPAGDYGWPPLRRFGHFLAPNIHPAIDQEALSPQAAVAGCAAGRRRSRGSPASRCWSRKPASRTVAARRIARNGSWLSGRRGSPKADPRGAAARIR